MLETLPQTFTVCKPPDQAAVDMSVPFSFLSRTDHELSLVCPTENAPQTCLAREDGWRAVRVRGAMAFSLVGILAELTGLLAGKGIPVFAVSTFDTDYLLTKQERFNEALEALRGGGCAVTEARAEIRKNG